MRRTDDGLARSAVACALLLACTGAFATGKLAEGVCSSMDIRNSAEQIHRLQGCRVIEGQLSIVLMERASQKSFANVSFPELREVTGYILIYRTKGVQNLGDMFPNLRVIRGMQLFKDFALVIFDNEHLQALGLRSLMKIERGAVRIQHNDQLCYIDTIDWKRIVADDAENIIKSNYDTRLCGLCPRAQSRLEERRLGHDQCPTNNNGRLLCWDDKHCQKICPSVCGDRGCMDDNKCCHSACLGGCWGPSANDCYVCRNFSVMYGKDRHCVESCPANFFALFSRCVTEQECRDLPAPPPVAAEVALHTEPKIAAYKIFDKKCIYHCPSGYMEKGTVSNASCVECPATGCVRECTGGKVDSVAAAEQFRGCTNLNGKLEISLRASGGNTMALLESALGEIRVINGSLMVARALPLVSLMFLKNLRRIIGNPNDPKDHVLYILNNPNLELLWDWSKHPPLNITGGIVFIHFNSKLCYNLILPLKNMISNPRSNFTEIEVSSDSNGDQASCLPISLQLNVSELRKNVVVLTWKPYCPDDIRRLIGYSVYYIATEVNITLYGQRDACSDSWNVIDVTIEEARNNTREESKSENILTKRCNLQPLFTPISQLTPFTRYAAYVKTYTTILDKRGAQSSIIYFRTLPGAPSPPLGVVVESLSPHEVLIRWSPPLMANGTVLLYHVELQANRYNRRKILAGNLNYCGNPSVLANMIAVRTEEATERHEEKATGQVENASCACSADSAPSANTNTATRFNSRAEQERMESINFENELQNQVYRKTERNKSKSATTRIKRSVEQSLNSMLVILSENITPKPGLNYSNSTDEEVKCSRNNRTEPNVCIVNDNVTGYVKSLYYELDGNTRLLKVVNMRHFTWYTVNIWACRAKHENETQDVYEQSWCSDRVFNTFRTLELVNADIVSNMQAYMVSSNKTQPEVNVTWEPPQNPNGFVVAYNVHYSRIDGSQGPDAGLQTCISTEDYEAGGHGYTLRNMAPGNYSLRVTPVTVSGAGNVSADVYIFIPERIPESSHEWIWGVIGGCVIMAVMLGGGVWYARRGLLPHGEANKLFASVNPEYVSTVYVPDEWEVPRANIEFLRELGQGSFGMVYEGIAKDIEKGKPETRCAVKTVNEHATDRERIEFLNEASVMKAFDTFHVVRLLGVVSRGQPTLVVMELMQHGDLKTYLRSHRPDSDSVPKKDNAPPTLQNILQMAIEIADGMAYLSAKKFVHRDLAARNCMVSEDLTVKVGDFGMTRDIYETDYYRKGTKGLLPVRWMSPESLKDGVFSSNTDVWSYGVVLWEMATLAMQPYQGLSNEQVVRYVVEGGVMERPEHCPDRLYELMRACWAHRPAARPSFLQLVADLAPSAQPHFRHRSFFHSPQGQELYSLQQAASEEEPEAAELDVGAVATGSASNLFGVSGRLASWVRELSSLRSRDDAAEQLQPLRPAKPPNGQLPEPPPPPPAALC